LRDGRAPGRGEAGRLRRWGEDVRDAIFFKTPAPDYLEFGGVAYERVGVIPAHTGYIAPAYSRVRFLTQT
jgi:hypothetical protein